MMMKQWTKRAGNYSICVLSTIMPMIFSSQYVAGVLIVFLKNSTYNFSLCSVEYAVPVPFKELRVNVIFLGRNEFGILYWPEILGIIVLANILRKAH